MRWIALTCFPVRLVCQRSLKVPVHMSFAEQRCERSSVQDSVPRSFLIPPPYFRPSFTDCSFIDPEVHASHAPSPAQVGADASSAPLTHSHSIGRSHRTLG